MKRFVPIIILLAIGSGLFFWFKNRNSGNIQNQIIVSGNIEATEVDCSFKISGRVDEIFFDEGDAVKEGDLIARLDNREITKEVAQTKSALVETRSRLPQLLTTIEHQEEATNAQIEQALANLNAAKAMLEELQAGARSQEIEEAEAAMKAAHSDMKNLEAEWARAKKLYLKGIVSQQRRDNAKTAYDIARERYEGARERYELVKEGPREEKINAAKAQVTLSKASLRLARTNKLLIKRYQQELVTTKAQIERMEAALKLAEIRLMETDLLAPISGVVLVRDAEPKEVVPAGTPILTLGDLEKVWLKAYIPETDLGRIRLGQQVKVTTDSFPEKIYRGRISFISSKAEFTPKNVQTHKERVKLVYRIKIAIKNPEMELKPGIPADGVIELNSRIPIDQNNHPQK